MSDKEEPKEAEGAAKPKSKKKLILILVVVLLLVGGGAGFFLMSGGEDKEAAHEEVEEVKVFKTIKLEPFIVNLSEAKSFLKVALLIEYDETLLHKLQSSAEGGGGHGEGGSGGEAAPEGGFPAGMIEKEARVRDRIISVLSAKTPAEVLSVTGKQALKDEIIEGINEVLELPEPVIVNIYFTEFIVQ